MFVIPLWAFFPGRGRSPPEWTSASLVNTRNPTTLFSCRPTLNKHPFKVAPQTWQGSSSPERGQQHSKVTADPGKGEDNYTHQSNCGPSSRLREDFWSDCRPYPPMKASEGRTQGEYPAVRCYCNPGKCLV